MSKKDSLKKVAIAATITTAVAIGKKISDEKEKPKLISPDRDENTKAYLIGNGIGNLSLAYGLINHANLPGENITIYKKKYNEFLPINDKTGMPNYKTFDDRYIFSNFANTYEILKEILSDEELENLKNKIDNPDNIEIIDLNSHVYRDIFVVSENTKFKIKKLLLKPKSFDENETIEKYFYFTDFVDSSLYYLLATLFNLRRTSLVSELREAILSIYPSTDSFDVRTVTFHRDFENYLKDKGVNIIEGHEFVKLEIKDGAVDKILFVNNSQIVEQYVEKTDIVSAEAPTYIDKISLGDLNKIPEIVHESSILKEKDTHYKGKISGNAPENSIIYVKLSFVNDHFARKIRERYPNKDTFILKLKTGISVKLRGNDVIVKVLNPNRSSIFIGNNFDALNGEDFFFELVKTFNLDDSYGELRMSLKSVYITLLPDYRNGIGSDEGFLSDEISNLAYISSMNKYFGTNYSVEKLVKQGLYIAHEMMGIDHIDIIEDEPDKADVKEFLDKILKTK
ncbi:oleate hydratase [Peptoniphilus sp.]|jgi:hypothetical protein|uniref:oleate hydratase n=1 Tax=Peptoniphilus sp. TaxID=1971214 RepID=UPI003D8EC146